MIVLSIACIILFSSLFGAIALGVLFNANNNFRRGNYARYETLIKVCWVMLAISVVLGLLSPFVLAAMGLTY
jgi:hypothetical protein